MSTILIKAIEYPTEKVINLTDLTKNGLISLREELEQFKEVLDDMIERKED